LFDAGEGGMLSCQGGSQFGTETPLRTRAAEEAPPNSCARETVYGSRKSARRSRDSPFRCGKASVRSNFSGSPLRSQAPALRLRESPLRFQKSAPYSGEADLCASGAETTLAAPQPASESISLDYNLLLCLVRIKAMFQWRCQRLDVLITMEVPAPSEMSGKW
jgi:hypothetical protein